MFVAFINFMVLGLVLVSKESSTVATVVGWLMYIVGLFCAVFSYEKFKGKTQETNELVENMAPALAILAMKDLKKVMKKKSKGEVSDVRKSEES